jgi:hypothetical protein
MAGRFPRRFPEKAGDWKVERCAREKSQSKRAGAEGSWVVTSRHVTTVALLLLAYYIRPINRRAAVAPLFLTFIPTRVSVS